VQTTTSRALQIATAERMSMGRVGVGLALLLRPRLVPGLLGVDSATSTRISWVLQMLGAREVALGVGSVVAGRSGDRRSARTWLVAGLCCDAVDALVVASAVGRGRLRGAPGAAVVAVAAGAVAVQAAELGRR